MGHGSIGEQFRNYLWNFTEPRKWCKNKRNQVYTRSTNIIPDYKIANFKPINSFNVVIQDLTPETKYYYKVGNASDGYSAIDSFTAPADPDANKPFSFVISPDTQGKSVSQFGNTTSYTTILRKMKQDAAFLIHTGDLVEDASVSDQWQYFFDASQNLLNTLPIMATPGNHDSIPMIKI